ncbi:hypothetical protein O3Q51_16745 [Cryomorphaceae bacterium 1068]|nr:hypothetical protein [Cryomorphaceae bacterium 1068]
MKFIKILTATLCFVAFSFGAIAQEETPSALPPVKDLPKEGEVKNYYEFDKETSYKLYDSEGTLIKEGTEKMVDVTELPKGTYFFSFDEKRVVYKKD